MSITAEQRARRREHIGSSDVAAIVGMSPFRTPADVWASKVYETSDDTKSWQEAGNFLEAGCLDWAESYLGVLIYRGIEVREDGQVLAANLDGQTQGKMQPVEAKTTGVVGPVFGEWGEELTDQVPPHVVIQCQHQLGVAGGDVAWVPALIGGRGFVMFRVDRDDRLIRILRQRCLAWWEEHVVARKMPEGPPPRPEILAAIKRREDGFVMPVPDDVVQRYLEINQLALAMKKQAEDAKAELIAYLGDAAAGAWGGGQITYKLTQRRESIQKATSYRTLRVTPDKE